MTAKHPSRKNIRLENYDYSTAGYYFITICTKDKAETLSNIVVGANCVRPKLSEVGKVIEYEMQKLTNIYERVCVDKYVIMPNHVHLIIIISDDINSGRTQFAPTLPRIIKQFKGSITKQLGRKIWQSSFYDRIIRNEKEYLQICKYIENNPIKWTEDEYYVDIEKM